MLLLLILLLVVVGFLGLIVPVLEIFGYVIMGLIVATVIVKLVKSIKDSGDKKD